MPLHEHESEIATGAFCDFALRYYESAPYGRVGARCQHLAAARRASSPKAVAISGPILSIVQPCFGHTGLECGAEVCRPSVNPAFMRVTLDGVRSANAFHAEPETNR